MSDKTREQVRKDFEEWAKTSYELHKHEYQSDYSSVYTQSAWGAWQAAKEQYSNPQPQKVEREPEIEEGSETKGMNLGERIAHVGGRENAAGYIEFGSVMAVQALIAHVLRDIDRPSQPTAPKVPQSVDEWIDDLEDAAVGYVTGAPEAAKELARTASKNLRTFMAGKVLVPVEPTIKMIAAMGESQAIDDDGIFPSLCDLLDFSGSNKTRAVIIAAYQAMLTAGKEGV